MEYRIKNISKVQELIGVNELNTVVENIMMKIYEDHCGIILFNQASNSKYEYLQTGCIHLGVSQERERLHILWDLFHEYGHHKDDKLQGPRTKEQESIREQFAWVIADEEFLKVTELDAYKESYRTYRDSCLSTYEVYDYKGLL